MTSDGLRAQIEDLKTRVEDRKTCAARNCTLCPKEAAADIEKLTIQLGAALKWAEKHAARACGESLVRAIEGAGS